jgi:glycine hydroxymethyltransferase
LGTELRIHGLDLVSGGTDNHMLLVNLSRIGITGRDAEEALGMAGIVVNRNAIPFDTRPPNITSGIRLGTPAVTSRGFGREEMKQIASLIAKVVTHISDKEVKDEVSWEVSRMCKLFPAPGIDNFYDS